MADDQIRYDILTQDALRGVVRKVLSEVARTGLPGEHHFYITFGTRSPGVRVSSRVLEKYPQEMTIVLQHQYWELKVDEHSFEVGLSFGGVPERLAVPFTAIKGFADPTAQFALQFEPVTGEPVADAETIAEAEKEPEIPAILQQAADEPKEKPRAQKPVKAIKAEKADQPPKTDEAERSADIVSIDAFRKKN